MAKYDDQLKRSLYLMEYKTPVKKESSSVWYHANGADGKVYGIIKEGTKFYIKTTESGKENIAESYDYIGGFNNRRENEFKDYNKATKHLELSLMSLNEAYGKKSDVSTVDFKRSEKIWNGLTEEARKELDRVNQIFENSCKIGMNCIKDEEAKGHSTGDSTEKNNKPFEKKVTPNMEYKGDGESKDDYDKVGNVDKDLQSDAMKSKNSNLNDDGTDKEYKDAHDDLDGDGVADKDPKGAKAVKMNESTLEEELAEFMSEFDDELAGTGEDVTPDDFGAEAPVEEPAFPEAAPEVAPEEPVADDFGTPDVSNLPAWGDDEETVEQPLGECGAMPQAPAQAPVNEEEAITGPNKVLDKEGNPINGTDNGVDGEKDEKWRRVGDKAEIKEEEGYGETDQSEKPETMDNYKFGYNDEKKLPVQSWEKMDESKLVKALTESIFKQLVAEHAAKKPAKKKMTLNEYIDKIVKEEITKLDAWGKHPRYQKEPMTHPDAKEVLAGTADRDFNDDSAKGSEKYGKKIGDGKPFDKTVEMLTDQVMSQLKESLRNKKAGKK